MSDNEDDLGFEGDEGNAPEQDIKLDENGFPINDATGAEGGAGGGGGAPGVYSNAGKFAKRDNPLLERMKALEEKKKKEAEEAAKAAKKAAMIAAFEKKAPAGGAGGANAPGTPTAGTGRSTASGEDSPRVPDSVPKTKLDSNLNKLVNSESPPLWDTRTQTSVWETGDIFVCLLHFFVCTTGMKTLELPYLPPLPSPTSLSPPLSLSPCRRCQEAGSKDDPDWWSWRSWWSWRPCWWGGRSWRWCC